MALLKICFQLITPDDVPLRVGVERIHFGAAVVGKSLDRAVDSTVRGLKEQWGGRQRTRKMTIAIPPRRTIAANTRSNARTTLYTGTDCRGLFANFNGDEEGCQGDQDMR